MATSKRKENTKIKYKFSGTFVVEDEEKLNIFIMVTLGTYKYHNIVFFCWKEKKLK